MSDLSFVSPLSITAAMITSSTAVVHSSTEADWSSGASYTKGAVVYRPSLGRRFENQIPGINPNPPEDDSDRWYDLGATDQMAMFDGETSTQSIADSTLTVVLRPGAFNALFLAGLDGTSLSILVKDQPGGTAVYTYSGTLEGSQPDDYWEYFFSPFEPQTDFFVNGLVPYVSCEVTITVSNPGLIARCGMAALGDEVVVATTLSGVEVTPKSYSRIVADSRGATSIKKGKSARDMTVNGLLDMSEFTAVNDALTRVLDVPIVVIATSTVALSAMRVFGLVNGRLIENGQKASLNLTVQGMI